MQYKVMRSIVFASSIVLTLFFFKSYGFRKFAAAVKQTVMEERGGDSGGGDSGGDVAGE
jgi:hypothetical protein